MSSEMQNIQWFPGHMTKTRRKIQEILPIIDAVAEIVDARIPVSSRNPDLADIIKDKPLMILLNKCDMADPVETAKWIDYYKKQGISAVPVDCKTGKGIGNFKEMV
ncbi:MAG: ribosome biogenesis GTPase YlqF, partial [Acutalibacteraceae bacterium]|nr:ribosome biogenesis GTPase YlqF [Acutalibacteraceae bacterium]